MWDILYYAGAALLGGLIGWAIGSAISKYLDKAKEWFAQVWREIPRVVKAVGVLVRINANRLKKHLIALLSNDEVEEYVENGDEGVEVDPDEIPADALKALNEDGYIPVAVYE